MGKEVILGFAGGYSFSVIKPFISTLRKTGFKGDIVLFQDKIKSHEREKGKIKYNVEFKQIVLDRPYYFDGNATIKINENDTKSPNVRRYFAYYHFLKENKDYYSKVAIADTRDIIFQKNPFDNKINWSKIHLFLEDDNLKIGKSLINTQWIERAYGTKEAENRKHNIVSCSGYTMGSRDAMLDYLKTMVKEFDRLDSENIKLGGGVDQGVHNVLIYKGYFPSCQLHKNHENELNVILSGTSNFRFIDNLVKTNTNKTIAVVHQYDRVPFLLKKYNFKEYLKGINFNAFKNKFSRIINR